MTAARVRKPKTRPTLGDFMASLDHDAWEACGSAGSDDPWDRDADDHPSTARGFAEAMVGRAGPEARTGLGYWGRRVRTERVAEVVARAAHLPGHAGWAGNFRLLALSDALAILTRHSDVAELHVVRTARPGDLRLTPAKVAAEAGETWLPWGEPPSEGPRPDEFVGIARAMLTACGHRACTTVRVTHPWDATEVARVTCLDQETTDDVGDVMALIRLVAATTVGPHRYWYYERGPIHLLSSFACERSETTIAVARHGSAVLRAIARQEARREVSTWLRGRELVEAADRAEALWTRLKHEGREDAA